MEKELQKLIELSKRKLEFDKTDSWSKGSTTYLQGVYEELDEIQAEIKTKNNIYLEDELGDFLWDFFNLLVNLESEGRIDMKKVPIRAYNKFTERINGIENGISWDETKIKQKQIIKKEQEAKLNKN